MRPSRYGLHALLALALLALLAGPALAQKSTISSRSGGRSAGSSGGSSAGRLSPVGHPSGPSSIGAPSSRSAPSTATLSPSFPSRGSSGGRAPSTLTGGSRSSGRSGGSWATLAPGAGKSTIGSRTGGTLSPSFPVQGRAPAAVALAPGVASGRSSLAPGVAGGKSGLAPGAAGFRGSLAGGSSTSGKRFLPVGTLPVRGPSGVDDWRKRTVVRRGTTFIFFDPFFFGQPFFFRDGFFFGDGFFFNHDPFFFGHRFVFGDPFFFGHRFRFGRPLLFGPPHLSLFWGWPGFWTHGAYGSGSGYAEGYQQGFDQGFESGQSYGGGYAEQVAPLDAGPYAGPALGLAPRAELPTAPRFTAGLRSMAAGQYAAALAAFEDYVRQQPSDPRGKLASGTALLALGRVDEAANAFRRGIDEAAPAVPVEFDMPALFGSRSAFRAAQGRLEDYVRAHADDPNGRFDLGVLYLWSGELDAAQTLLSGLGADPYADRLVRQILGG